MVMWVCWPPHEAPVSADREAPWAIELRRLAASPEGELEAFALLDRAAGTLARRRVDQGVLSEGARRFAELVADGLLALGRRWKQAPSPPRGTSLGLSEALWDASIAAGDGPMAATSLRLRRYRNARPSRSEHSGAATPSPDLFILIGDGQYWGWLLGNPVDHLPGGPPPPGLAPLVMRYFQLVNDDTMDDLLDRSEELGDALRALEAQARGLDHASATHVADQVARILDSFYSEE